MTMDLPSRLLVNGRISEDQFAKMVDELKSDPAGPGQLIDLLHEDNPVYNQRSTAAAIRMRGWVLLVLGQQPLSATALLFVLEELDNGRDAYLVAVAAHSLRNSAQPSAAIAPFLMRALTNIQFHDDFVCLDRYGGYAISPGAREGGLASTTAVDELLASLHWLGSGAREALPVMEALLSDNAKGGGALSQTQLGKLQTIFESLKTAEELPGAVEDCCDLSSLFGAFRQWLPCPRVDAKEISKVVFEDQDGKFTTFREFFHGCPSVVAFFYSRCTNPFKCSLTLAKLARLQKLLVERHMVGQIRTAAITYDPEFDLPERVRGYGASRGVRMDADNRLLRPVEGIEALRKYFRLGVNFVGSVVNRHRVELYVLDVQGGITASFERIQWDENEVLDCAAALLTTQVSNTWTGARYDEPIRHNLRADSHVSARLALAEINSSNPAKDKGPAKGSAKGSGLSAALPVLALAVALFPKCPVCWAAYLSVFGIAGLGQLSYSPWLLPLLAVLMLVNLASLWLQNRRQERMAGFYLAVAGAFTILVPGISFRLEYASLAGVLLTLTGSLLGVLSSSANIDRHARS